MAQYYDIVLGLIPLALGGITAALLTLGISLTLAVPIAATVSVGLIGHGLFVRAPGTPTAPQPARQPDTTGFNTTD